MLTTKQKQTAAKIRKSHARRSWKGLVNTAKRKKTRASSTNNERKNTAYCKKERTGDAAHGDMKPATRNQSPQTNPPNKRASRTSCRRSNIGRSSPNNHLEGKARRQRLWLVFDWVKGENFQTGTLRYCLFPPGVSNKALPAVQGRTMEAPEDGNYPSTVFRSQSVGYVKS